MCGRVIRLVAVGLVAVSLLATGCGTDPSTSADDAAGTPSPVTPAARATPVPSAFCQVCGRPGSVVRVDEGTTRVDAADCDLRGVSVMGPQPACGGALVPGRGMGVTSIADVVEGLPCSVDVSVTRHGDVTVKVVRG